MPSKEELLAELDVQLAIVRRSATIAADLHARRSRMVDDIDQEIGEEVRRQAEAVDAITALLEESEAREAVFGGKDKTLRRPDGEIELVSSTSLVIDNVEKALAWLRSKHLLLRYTRPPKERELDKVKIKKNPKLVEKMPGVHLETTENLTVKVPGISTPLTRMFKGLKRKLK